MKSNASNQNPLTVILLIISFIGLLVLTNFIQPTNSSDLRDTSLAQTAMAMPHVNVHVRYTIRVFGREAKTVYQVPEVRYNYDGSTNEGAEKKVYSSTYFEEQRETGKEVFLDAWLEYGEATQIACSILVNYNNEKQYEMKSEGDRRAKCQGVIPHPSQVK